MGKAVLQKLREQVKEQADEIERLKFNLAEQAQKETELTRLLQRSADEKKELQRQLDAEKVRLNGFQLELQARHSELPFLVAQIEALITANQWPETVSGILSAIRTTINALQEFTKAQQPTLEPASWLLLAKKLGLAATFISRRQPALAHHASMAEAGR